MSSTAAPADPRLDLLRRLYPPRTLIHVGIGHGTGAMHSWRDWSEPEDVILIDADSAPRTHWAASLAAARPRWRLFDGTLLDQADGPVSYYHASNRNEDSLLDPRQLNALWPNLQQREQRQRPAKRLDSLLGELDLGTRLQAPTPIWLLIDCLPAGRILRGASALLEQATLIWARVLLQPLDDADKDAGASLASLETQLKPLRYRCIHIIPDLHPSLGEALFVRDWSKAARAEAERQTQRADRCEQQLDQCTQALAAATAENRERRQRQDLTEDEILKARTQIDFIRELLQEPARD